MAKKGTYFGVSTEEREAVAGPSGEFVRRLANGQIGPPSISYLQAAMSPELYVPPRLIDPFVQYAPLIPSLKDQLETWRRYNDEILGHPLTDDQLADVNTATGHIQTVRDSLVLVARFGRTEKDLFEAAATILKENHPNFTRGASLGDGYKIRRYAKQTIPYKPGFHVVHLNLAAYWEPEDGRSGDDVRVQAKAAGEKLGYIEPLQFYGLAPKLLQKMDGTNLPYLDPAGYEVKPSGGSGWRCAPYLDWYAGYSEVRLSSYSVAFHRRYYSAPVVRELAA